MSFAALALCARAANDTTRAQINNIPSKSHVIPLLSYQCVANYFFTVFIFKIDLFLDKLKNFTKEDDQLRELTKITKRYRRNKLKLKRKIHTIISL